MADRYEIRGKRLRWTLHRIDDDPEFGFDEQIGVFGLKSDAQAALDAIKKHPDMDFSEWFYGKSIFAENDVVNREYIAASLYARWRDIGTHMHVYAKRDFMDKIAHLLYAVAADYSNKIEDIEMTHAQQQAGAAW
jgi:hypothetical protein